MDVGKSKGNKGRSWGKGKKDKSHGKGNKIKNPRKLTGWYKKSILFELDYRKLEYVEGESRLKRLADGPKFKAISYNIYHINGFVFSTSQRDTKRVTQNSGVYMNAFTNYPASARDRNYKEEEELVAALMSLNTRLNSMSHTLHFILLEPCTVMIEGFILQDDDQGSMVMSDKNGQKFSCFLPKEDKTKTSKFVTQQNTSSLIVETQRKVMLKTPDELLEVFKDKCFYRQEGWWSYEFCYQKNFRQLHLEGDKQEDEDMLVPNSDLVVEGPQPMEVAAQVEAANTVENNKQIEDPPSSRFTWTIENFNRINTKTHYSDVLVVGLNGTLVSPKGNNVD
ncbi:hypothetical protein IFM89_030247 [Coptis chinensis]|uniref:Protein OS9-like domain-containing protein n=1 Tax=Coptis chinensis TaxID=261450 RepID=A0A835HY48_9MAGN|nr:hypothetical protein IFM89_030247 [Coptis chinensis]